MVRLARLAQLKRLHFDLRIIVVSLAIVSCAGRQYEMMCARHRREINCPLDQTNRQRNAPHRRTTPAIVPYLDSLGFSLIWYALGIVIVLVTNVAFDLLLWHW